MIAIVTIEAKEQNDAKMLDNQHQEEAEQDSARKKGKCNQIHF